MKWINFNKFASLINKVDQFYAITKVAAADDDYMDEDGDLALNIAIQSLDPNKYSEVIDNAINIGKLYKIAIDNKKGYQSLSQFINNFIDELEDEYGSDNSDLQETEDVLVLMQDEMESLMGGKVIKDSPEDAAWFYNQRKGIITEQYSEETPESIWNQAIGDVDQEPTINQLFEGGGDVGGKGPGHGIQTGKEKKIKDWAKTYENEKKRFARNLTPGILQPSSAAKVKELISTIDKLIPLSIEIDKLEKQKILESEVENPELDARLAKLNKDRAFLDEKREQIKTSIYRDIKIFDAKELNEQLKTVTDPKQKFILQQKIILANGRASRDIGKRKENRLRERLIQMFEAGNEPKGDQLTRFMNDIEAAHKLVKPIEEYNLEKAKEVAEKKKTIKIPGRRNQYEWAKMNLAGFNEHLRQALLAERKTVKDKIVGTKNKKISEEDKVFFKPYLDAIASAANKKDKTALLYAVKELTAFRDKFVMQNRVFKQYLISVRSSKFLYAFKDRIDILDKGGVENKQELTQEEYNFIKETIDMGKKLIAVYANLKIPSISGEAPIATHYGSPAEKIQKICNYLEGIIGEFDLPEEGQVNNG